MRITVRVDDNIMKGLVALTAAKNKTEAINVAIHDYLKKRAKLNFLQMKGKLHLENNWKQLRQAEKRENSN